MIRSSSWRRVLLMATVILLVMTALAGCGSRSQDEPTATPVEVEAPQVQVEEPAVDADATATAGAQLAGLGGGDAAEPAEAEPEASEQALEAAEQPSDADAAVAAGEGIVQGACNHPYYPIRDGAVYRYQMTSPGTELTEMTTQYRVTGPDTFVTIQNISDLSTEISWRCTQEGLLSTDFGMGGVEIPGVEYSLDAVSGVTFPVPDKLQVGNTWQSTFNMSGEMSMEGLAMKMKMDAIIDNEFIGFEEVTTPAGTFEAAKIDTNTTLDMQLDMGDMGDVPAMPTMPGISVGSTVWLAEGVGMVKSVSGDAMGGSSVMELVAIE